MYHTHLFPNMRNYCIQWNKVGFVVIPFLKNKEWNFELKISTWNLKWKSREEARLEEDLCLVPSLHISVRWLQLPTTAAPREPVRLFSMCACSHRLRCAHMPTHLEVDFNNITGSWGDGSVGKSTCCTTMRTWIQMFSPKFKKLG